MSFLLHVNDSHGKKIDFVVEKFDSIDNLKIKIWDKGRVPPSQQQLYYLGVELEDGKTLLDYDILEEITLQLAVNFVKTVVEKQIFVKLVKTGKVINLDVTSTDTVSSVKKRLWEREGVLPESQVLIYDESRLQDSRTLGSYSVWENATLYLINRQSRGNDKKLIHVKTSSRSVSHNSFSFEFDSFMTVDQLKGKIEKHVGVSPRQQRLISSGTELKDSRRSLGDYFVAEESIICLIVRTPMLRLFSGKETKRKHVNDTMDLHRS